MPKPDPALLRLCEVFDGRTALVFATGESLPRLWGAGQSPLPKIAVNDAWQIVPDADVVYACDGSWWRHHWDGVSAHPGIKVGYETGIEGVLDLKGTGSEGYDPRLGFVRHNSNSGAQAVHLAAQLGAGRIVLVGFDMQGPHFFGEHPEDIRRVQNFDLFIRRFKVLGGELARRGVEVVNATPGSALPWFSTVDLADELRLVA